jgi:hypothetical protein
MNGSIHYELVKATIADRQRQAEQIRLAREARATRHDDQSGAETGTRTRVGGTVFGRVRSVLRLKTA